jgi:hypothetical protein
MPLEVGQEASSVRGNKRLLLKAGDVIKVLVNKDEQAELTYTVPKGKIVNMSINISGVCKDK